MFVGLAQANQEVGIGNRTREVEEGPNGSLWLLRDGDAGALVELTPR